MNAIQETKHEAPSVEDQIRRILKEAGVRRRYANRRQIGEGTAPCIINFMWLLVNEKCTTFIPRGTYKLIRVAVSEEGTRHKPNAKLRLYDLQSNRHIYNFHMRTVRDVEGKDKETGRWDDDRRCRTYAMILDGAKHIEKLELYLTERAFRLCKEWGILGEDVPFSERSIYSPDYGKLPETVPAWARPRVLGLIDLMKEEMILERCCKMLGGHLDSLRAAAGAKTDKIRRERLGKHVKEYEASCYAYELKGFEPDFTLDLSELTVIKGALAERKRMNRRLTNVRFIKRSIQFAMDRCGNKWFANAAESALKDTKNMKKRRVQALDLSSVDPSYAGLKLVRMTWIGKQKVTDWEAMGCSPASV